MSTQTLQPGPASGARTRVALAILVGGLVAGTVDIGTAALINMLDPRVILRFVAGGVQGKAALQGGAQSAWLGLCLQWGMSIVIAAIFVIAATRLRWLTARWAMAGLAYGVVVFVVMDYVVMPLPAWRRINHFSAAALAMNLVATLVFGLIVAYAARKLLGRVRA